MVIPVAIFLIPYLIILIFFLFLSAANIYHIVRYGSFDAKNSTITSLFLLYSIAILLFTVLYLMSVDWAEPLEFGIPSITIDGFPQQ